MDLQDRIAFVTGGASGIGYATSRRLILAGAAVWIVDMDEASTMEAADSLGLLGQVHTLVADLAVPQTRQEAVRRIVQEAQRIDILVNNAGPAAISPAGRASFTAGISQSLGMTGELCRLVSPIMLDQRQGTIVNVASIAAMVGGGSDWYSAAKAGIIGLTIHLAGELSSGNVRVNAVAPGVIDTPRTRGLRREGAELAGEPFGSADEVAAVIAFLASDDASHVTGTVVPVDGGSHFARHRAEPRRPAPLGTGSRDG
ncbi:MAG: SDR family NAD(P)-dependent oxidoreductase [Acidimicrobiales bacterium]|jgi:NAD(P)-dependent dehydrogenase (short-subunit alcohol dehydrogenase family)